ncbi:hypothetical protein GY45DRAFT_1373234 [Cubamyces sp. BRFM 1775]|nr:hypothetical protein GY45DRAFT_1373234 [Cubamyces sp. BRFM 1775]
MAPKRKSDANASSAAPAKKGEDDKKSRAEVREVCKDKPSHRAEPAAPRFEGKFDLYSTQLPFLMSEYLPAGASKPDFSAVHDKILFYQAKPDFSLRVVLGTDGEGCLACSQIANPISDEELEPIMISGAMKRNVRFNAEEAAHASTIGTGEGFEGKLTLE